MFADSRLEGQEPPAARDSRSYGCVLVAGARAAQIDLLPVLSIWRTLPLEDLRMPTREVR